MIQSSFKPSEMRCHALFLSKPSLSKRDGSRKGDHEECRKCQKLQPFVDGCLDKTVTELHPFTASTLLPVHVPILCQRTNEEDSNPSPSQTVEEKCDIMSKAVQMFATKGLAAVKIQDYMSIHSTNVKLMSSTTSKNNGNSSQINFQYCSEVGNDDFIRRGVENFWNSSEGSALLQARYQHLDCKLHTIPTHVTRRKAPPDGMSLVHIDYPPSNDLSALTGEWWSRWKHILPRHELFKDIRRKIENRNESADQDQYEVVIDAKEFSSYFDLVGVVTTWICLQAGKETIKNHPLLVADASSVKNSYLHVYEVGNRRSVGVEFDPGMKWFYAPNMVRGDAWCFDTMRCPHVSVDLEEGDNDFVRESAEVRCLVLKKKIETF